MELFTTTGEAFLIVFSDGKVNFLHSTIPTINTRVLDSSNAIRSFHQSESWQFDCRYKRTIVYGYEDVEKRTNNQL